MKPMDNAERTLCIVYGIIAVLAFISMDGHLFMLAALVESFHSFPISESHLSAGAFRSMLSWAGLMFSHALQLSLPLIGTLLITNLALGILTRSAPQLNIFSIGFAITLTTGFIALSLTLPYLAPLLDGFVREGLEAGSRLMLEMGGH